MILTRRQWLRASCASVVATIIPSISRAAAPVSDIALYATLPEISDASLSPDGRHVALIDNDSMPARIQVHDLSGQTLPIIIRIDEKKLRNVIWGSNKHVIVAASKTNTARGNVWYPITPYKYESVSAHVFDITNGKDFIPSYGGNPLGNMQRVQTPQGYALVMPSTYVNARYSGLSTVDLATGKETQIVQNFSGEWAVTPTGEPVARAGAAFNSPDWTLELLKGKKWVKVYKQAADIDFPTLEGLGRTPQTVVIGIWDGERAGYYYEIGLDGIPHQLPGQMIEGDGYISPLFHPTTRLFCGFARFGDAVTYHYSDPAMQKLADMVAAALPDQRVEICEFASEDPRKVLIKAEGVDDPGTYYLIDFSNGAVKKVGETYPNLPEEWIAPRVADSYAAGDGLTIPAYVTVPPAAMMNTPENARNLPLIVLVHGGPQARDTIDFDWQAQLFASRGYAVLQPNFRGSSGYGAAFVEAGHGEWGLKMQSDLSDGVRYLAKEGLIDPKRVAIVGASYGGYAALAGAAFDKGIYRCAVSVAGVSDLSELVNLGLKGRFDSTGSLYVKRLLGDLKTLRARSPVYQAAQMDIPVLLIHGKDDSVVPVAHSQRMRNALKAAGKPVTYIELEGEDHWQSVKARRIEMATAILDFLALHNPT